MTTCVHFKDAWKRNKFNHPDLNKIEYLHVGNSNEFKLTTEQKQAFLKSKHFNGLGSLELRGQDIDDKFVEIMCENPTFSRLYRIDLSKNPNITDKSIEYIRESTLIGSIRDGPQICGRYGRTASYIYLNVEGTKVSKEMIKLSSTKAAFDGFDFGGFSIQYLHPITGKKTYHSSQAIKWVELESNFF